jgi:PTH1 family peptidyl-tRNA hydrolase
VGLGNPGKKYADTKHNVGFMVVETLAQRWGLNWKSPLRIKGKVAKTTQSVLLMPQTFMNLSGHAVHAAMKFYKILPEDVIVVYDDIDLDCGQLRLRYQGGSGGHKGMASILPHLGDSAKRIRIGVGRHQNKQVVDDVLSSFSKEEQKIIQEAIDEAVLALEEFHKDTPFVQIMNQFNRYPSTD